MLWGSQARRGLTGKYRPGVPCSAFPQPSSPNKEGSSCPYERMLPSAHSSRTCSLAPSETHRTRRPLSSICLVPCQHACRTPVVPLPPGRLAHHLEEVEGMSLRSVEYCVCDEADRLFEMGFMAQVGAAAWRGGSMLRCYGDAQLALGSWLWERLQYRYPSARHAGETLRASGRCPWRVRHCCCLLVLAHPTTCAQVHRPPAQLPSFGLVPPGVGPAQEDVPRPPDAAVLRHHARDPGGVRAGGPAGGVCW